MKKNYKLIGIIFSILFILFINTIYTEKTKDIINETELKVQNVYLAARLQKETYYRVIVGSFKNRSNAENMINEMKKLGYDSFIVTEMVNGEKFNRVVVGSFKEKDNANIRAKELNNLGYDTFICNFEKSQSNISKDSIYYVVITGSFSKRENAEIRISELKKKGYDCYINSEIIEEKIFYRVIVGSFIEESNAENMVEILVSEGYEAFIDIYVK